MQLVASAAEPRSAIGANVLDPLTPNTAKRVAYRHDTYMREGLVSLTKPLHAGRLYDHTFVVLKPDAVAGRRCGLILDTLRSEGWHPVAATPVGFTPLLTRELWRYQFNAASQQRIAVVDHLLGSGRSLLVLVEDRARPRWLPASARLTAAKGSAEPTAARKTDLRTRIGRVNGLFNFMHTADDPADVVRELQLFSYQAGWSWCAESLFDERTDAGEHRQQHLTQLIQELETEIPAHDLDIGKSLARLAARNDAWGECAVRHRTADKIDEWLGLLACCALPEGRARWDVLTVLTGWINCNEPGVTPLISTGTSEDWRPKAAHA
ncbi:hypothetical protein G3I40_03410 [Streptomyces sp. SID14478]|uniref:nucleoside-diphosphate kinase n=1 Tax=Streptomyces sp. SID14478 TaxID=2706073 RepID=UPI0013D9A271|nr:nucleoside-diphosphate kinase [Streptomyces sp. SID14478]NEB74289.1 hypothetical protein [Streptomyces sp. SID14478]